MMTISRRLVSIAAAAMVLSNPPLAGAQEADPIEASDEASPVAEPSVGADTMPSSALDTTVSPPADPALQEEDSLTPPLVGFDKGFFIRSADELYSLKINARMQGRFTFENLESWVEEDTLAVPDTEKDQEMAFAIARARLKLSGHVFSKAVGYEIQMDFGKGQFSLKDAFADFALVKNVLHLQVGQWKRPFSRQQITSSGSQELVDRAITDKAFGGGRDIGIALHNNYTKSPTFEWAVGLFNGTGESPWFEGKINTDEETGALSIDKKSKFNNVPDKFHPMAVVRVGFNTKGLKGYSEADLEGGPARFGIAASGLADFDADKDDKSGIRGQMDFILKAHGFSTTGALYLAAQSTSGFGNQEYSAWGGHLQAGYTVKKMVQPVLRYGVVNPKGGALEQEIMGGLALYFFGHNLKWQTDAGALLHNTEDPTGSIGLLADTLVRTQLQLAF
jgi:hypothetical protein